MTSDTADQNCYETLLIEKCHQDLSEQNCFCQETDIDILETSVLTGVTELSELQCPAGQICVNYLVSLYLRDPSHSENEKNRDLFCIYSDSPGPHYSGGDINATCHTPRR